MAVPIVILHGYGGSSEGWRNLADHLKESGVGPVVPVYLGNFETKEDDLVYGDLSEGLERELKGLADQGFLGGLAPRSFSIIAHSTGALVVRHWLQRYYGDRPDEIPLKHLILLAPANFGSRLAHHGNAAYGRFLHFLTERRPDGWETGKHVLDGLELASDLTWELAMGDILKPGPVNRPNVLNAEGFYTFVIIGNQPYTGRIQRRFPARAEAGSDGTVRIAAASLNSRRFDVDLTRESARIDTRAGQSEVPLAVIPHINHSEIKGNDQEKRAGWELIRAALEVNDDAAFADVKAMFTARTGETLTGDGDSLTHEFQQILVRVGDDTGTPVLDYDFDFEVFEQPRNAGQPMLEDEAASDSFNLTRKHVHTYGADSSSRCIFIDYTELQAAIRRLNPDQGVYLSMIAKNLSRKVSYETGDQTRVLVWSAGEREVSFFRPNTTTLVSITLDRTVREDLFELNLRQG